MAKKPDMKPAKDSNAPKQDEAKLNKKVSTSSADDVEIIPAPVKEILENQGINLDDPQIRGAVQITFEATSYKGPMPPPGMLQAYDQIRPGISDKIIEWTDKQVNHRIALESSAIERNEDRMDTGQKIAGSAAIAGIIAACILGVFGDPSAAIAVVAIGVGGPTVGFLVRTFTQFSS